MNILFVSMIGIRLEERGIYSDLIQGLIEAGHSVTLMDDEKKKDIKTQVAGFTIIPLWISITKIKNRYIKGIVSLFMEIIIIFMIHVKMKNKKIDLLLYATPPIMYTHIIRYCKRKYHCKGFLMLKDIFPQNAVDEGLLRKDGILFRHFRRKEIELYRLSDSIGCMSKGNIKYIRRHNPEIPKDKIVFFPNSIHLSSHSDECSKSHCMRDRLGISEDRIVFVFGGNLGIAQGIPFLAEVMNSLCEHPKAYFLIVGSGTHADRIKKAVEKQKNVTYLERLPREEFDALLKECNVGIVSLGAMYTMPNYPSRMLSYMDAAMPMLAITDHVTDVRSLLETEAGCGLWSLAGDMEAAIKNVETFCKEEQMRIDMGRKGRDYCKKYFNVEESVAVLEQRINKEG